MAILYGTTSTGDTLPVQVDQAGRLVAEGLQGVKGDKGDQGDPGVGTLPPNPEDGKVLGWENGQLAWVDGGAGSSFFFEADYLIVAGGGNGNNFQADGWAGGGAGGLINTVTGEKSGGGANGAGPVQLSTSSMYQLTVGGIEENTVFNGLNVNEEAVAGGSGAVSNGGSGAGAKPEHGSSTPGFSGIYQQGYDGAPGGNWAYVDCYDARYACNAECISDGTGGGGGGAGSAASGYSGGEGVQSAITGTLTWYASGGNGSRACDGVTDSYPTARGSLGSGGGKDEAAQPGVLVIRAPIGIGVIVESGSFNYSQVQHSPYTSFIFTSGTGEISFTGSQTLLELISTTHIDVLRSH